MVAIKKGRPRKIKDRSTKEIDMDVLIEAAKIQCTLPEIAALCRISLSSLEHNEELLRVIEENRKEGIASIRRMQWQAAMKGSADMLKWIGKQYAKQAEKQETKNDDRITIVIEAEDKDI